MSATKPGQGPGRRPNLPQAGVAAIEFALLAIVFFTIIFAIIELARLLYVYNTLQEVTRRAASAAINVYPNEATTIAAVKRAAIFRNSSGELVLAPPVTDAHVRLSYLRSDLNVIPTGSLPPNAATNRQICANNPHAANCIRFVQAQVCDPAVADACTAVRSQTLLPLIELNLPLHKATTITPVGSLGYVPGTPPN
jgi:Flp pilus assembly protein TadG